MVAACMSEPVHVNAERYKRWRRNILLPGVILALCIPLQLLAQVFKPEWTIPAVEWAVLGLLATYYLTSLRKVETGMIAGITLLEEPVLEVGAGWYFVPRFLMEIDFMPAYTLQDQFPGNPEQVSKRDDNMGLLPGEFRPIRAMTAGAREEDGEDPINTRLTLELIFAVRWRVRIDGFFNVYVKIPGRNWAEKVQNIRQHLRDTGETELVEEITERTPFEINRDMHLLNDSLKEELQAAVENWGIEIEEARIQAPDWPHDLNIKLSQIAEAKATKIIVRTQAEAESARLTLVAEGKANEINLLAEAERNRLAKVGEGQRAAADALGITGREFYAGEIAKETVGEGDLILGEAGIGQAIGLGAHVLDKFQKKDEPK